MLSLSSLYQHQCSSFLSSLYCVILGSWSTRSQPLNRVLVMVSLQDQSLHQCLVSLCHPWKYHCLELEMMRIDTKSVVIVNKISLKNTCHLTVGWQSVRQIADRQPTVGQLLADSFQQTCWVTVSQQSV